MKPLPIDDHLPALIGAIRAERALVLVAPPGSGKTTRLPPALLRAGLLGDEHPATVLLQPRRVAARASAARIAEENGWSLGREVGYQIRFERRIGPETRLRVVTEGILTRQLLADPFLEGVGAVVLDEFHERSLHSDLALALLREVREAVRDDLILVVMSATLDAEPVARFLGGCPVVSVEGRAFPVEIVRRPPTARTPLPEQVGSAVEDLLAGRLGPTGRDPGDVLAFLPGAEEIRRSSSRLGALAERLGLLVLPLHGSLPAEDQDRALRPADRRKVILATNVAETSLTIEGVSSVIDSGLARFAAHDPARGIDRLVLGRISRASAAQRAGRAGRTGPGLCVRLWSPRDERGMPEYDVPEIRRVDLASTLLALHAWGQADPARFAWFEPPDEASLAAADRLLAMLGAIDSEGGRITPIGRRLLELPLHPRLGRMLLAASGVGRLREGAAMAALLAERDVLLASRPFGESGVPEVRSRSDLLVRLDLLAEAERARSPARVRALGLDPSGVRRVLQARDELIRLGRRLGRSAVPRPEPDDEDDLLQLVLLAYPDRVARRRGPGSVSGVMVGGRGVRLGPESTVRDAELFLALDPRESRRGGAPEARVLIASEVRPDWLEKFFPESICRERSVGYDEARGRAVARAKTLYRGLVLREDEHGAVPADEASATLAEALAIRARDFVREEESAAAWLDRLGCLRGWMPEADLPAFDDRVLSEVIASACLGKTRAEEVRRQSLVPFLRARLSQAQARLIDEQAPEALTAPSGHRHRLRYEPGRPPVLAVRIQEVFGWHETPRIAGGRIAVLLHLLGPNFRPVQITDDLRSFWASTYHQVRKDLRARYPRHAWPEDPLSARAGPSARTDRGRPPGRESDRR